MDVDKKKPIVVKYGLNHITEVRQSGDQEEGGELADSGGFNTVPPLG